MNNITIELTPDRAEWFVICEREKDYLSNCLGAKSKLEKILNFKQANILGVMGGSIIIDVDLIGVWHNIKVVLNEHY